MAAALRFHDSRPAILKMDMIPRNVIYAFRYSSALIIRITTHFYPFPKCVTKCVVAVRLQADWKSTETVDGVVEII